jgi:hypothetical protein
MDRSFRAVQRLAMGRPAGISHTRRRFVQGAGMAGLALVAGCEGLPFQALPPYVLA